jgi:Tfp pilus assembly pilus retraction ATPase PilT
VLQTGKSQGMRSLDDTLHELVQTGAITKQQAALNADKPEYFH